MTEKPRNVHFWVYHNGSDVKLTIEPGKTITYGYFQRTDEGWTREASTYTHEGNRVLSEWFRDGVDCDGRMEYEGSAWFYIADAHAYVQEKADGIGGHVITYPKYHSGKNSQRDYSAEAMGY